jgi:hypothetical protein
MRKLIQGNQIKTHIEKINLIKMRRKKEGKYNKKHLF